MSPEKYESRLAEISNELAGRTHGCDLLMRERGHLHLHFGNTQLARADFDAIIYEDSKRVKPPRIASDSEFKAIGVTLWLEDRREIATAYWRFVAETFIKGRVSGTSHPVYAGLFSWFGAVMTRNKDDLDLTSRLFERLLEKQWLMFNFGRWPGTIAQFFLNQISELKADRDSCSDRLNLEFALALRAKEKGRHAAFRQHMQNAANVTDDIYQVYNNFNYFLACHVSGVAEAEP